MRDSKDALVVLGAAPLLMAELRGAVGVPHSCQMRNLSEISGQELDILTGRKPRQRLVRDKGRPNKAQKKALRRTRQEAMISEKKRQASSLFSEAGKGVSILSFDWERIEAITSGSAQMTPGERAFLIEDTARFEECQETQQQLAAMNDADLMNTAYATWAEYASGQV